MVGCLDIPEVISLVMHQQIDYFIQLVHNYNEDLIGVFYSRLHDKWGSCFKFAIGNIVYEFTDDLWKSLFSITVINDVDNDEVDPLVTNTNTHIHFK